MALSQELAQVWTRRLVIRLSKRKRITFNDVTVEQALPECLSAFLNYSDGVQFVVVDIENDRIRHIVLTCLHEIRSSGSGTHWTSMHYDGHDDDITALKPIVTFGHLTELLLKNVGDASLLSISQLDNLVSFEWSQRAVEQGPLHQAYSMEEFTNRLTHMLGGKQLGRLTLGHLSLLESDGLLQLLHSLDLKPASLTLKVKCCRHVCMATVGDNLHARVRLAITDLELHTRGYTDFGILYTNSFSGLANLKRAAFYQVHCKPEEDLHNMMTTFAPNIVRFGDAQLPAEWFHLALRSTSADIVFDCMFKHNILKKVSEQHDGTMERKPYYAYKAKLENGMKPFVIHVRMS